MRTIKTALTIVIVFVLMLIVAANLQFVTLKLLPPALATTDWSIDLPLAAVVAAGILVGIFLGLVLEYLREAKHRSRISEQRAEIRRLKAENAELARRAGVDSDEMALLAG